MTAAIQYSPNIYLSYKTDVTPAILSHNFVMQLYRATKSSYATAHVAAAINRITNMASVTHLNFFIYRVNGSHVYYAILQLHDA